MTNRKDLINAYKQRKVTGGVFIVTDTANGRYLLDSGPDIQARQNAFNFSVTTDNPFDYKMRQDWRDHGASAFTFEILDTLDKKEAQTQEQFMEDLKMLEEIQAEKLDSGKRY